MDVQSSAASQLSDRELTITRIFDAPRTLVFKAWTDPRHLANWWGPRGFTLPSCSVDLRPGGEYRLHMRGPNDDDHYMVGIFREIARCSSRRVHHRGRRVADVPVGSRGPREVRA